MFNFGNLSKSKASSDQSASVYLTQQFSGACNITCQNTMNNVAIDIVNSNVGGDVSVTQACSTNGSCMIGSSMDSTMDVFFKAANSSGAKNATSGLVSYGNIDLSTSKTRQDVRLSSYQNTNESCNIGSYNEMNNVTIFAANSNIGGNVSINQTGSTGGNCSLQSSMSSAATATGLSDNISHSGKGGKGSGLIHFIIIISILLIAFFIAKSIAGNSQGNEQKRAELEIAMARAEAGCPGGQKPIINVKTGLPYIDPKTMRPVCPYPTLNPGATPGTGMQTPSSTSMQTPSSTSMQTPSSTSMQTPSSTSMQTPFQMVNIISK